MLRWPDRDAVHAAVTAWADELVRRHPEVEAVGYFGSYARGDWGVGSDVDVVVVVERTRDRFERRALRYDATGLPVPADVLVYTRDEWDAMKGSTGPGSLPDTVVWAYQARPRT